MLVECFENLGRKAIVLRLRSFYRSWWYTALVVLLMTIANLFSLELPVFYCYLLLGAGAVLFDDDLAAVIPIILCCYMSISLENNPANFSPTNERGTISAFYDPNFVIQLLFVLGAAVILLAARLVSLLLWGERRRAPALSLGFGALGISYVLGGIFSEFYDFRTAFFGLVQIASLCALYFFFYYAVDWRRVSRDHWAKLFTLLGCGILIELIGIYAKYQVALTLLEPGKDFRHYLQTGWGMYNNVGCNLSMCLPAAFSLASSKKHGWVYTIVGIAIAVGIVFTQSRGSILFGGIVFLASLVMSLVYSKGRERRNQLIVTAVIGGLLVILLGVMLGVPAFREKVLKIYSSLLEQGFSDNGRYEIYEQGIAHFRSAPFFGVGFYQCDAYRWGIPNGAQVFLPPRYHNTVIQLLATGGIFAICCYLVHRVQTCLLLFRHPSAEKTFIAFCIAALLLTSQLECHFFSFGPGLLYGVLLVFAEGSDVLKGSVYRTD